MKWVSHWVKYPYPSLHDVPYLVTRVATTVKCDSVSSWVWFTGKYNKWDKVDPAELFSQAPTEKKEANPKLNMVKFLQVCEGVKAHQGGPSQLPIS